jgi:hypothetical protein
VLKERRLWPDVTASPAHLAKWDHQVLQDETATGESKEKTVRMRNNSKESADARDREVQPVQPDQRAMPEKMAPLEPPAQKVQLVKPASKVLPAKKALKARLAMLESLAKMPTIVLALTAMAVVIHPELLSEERKKATNHTVNETAPGRKRLIRSS